MLLFHNVERDNEGSCRDRGAYNNWCVWGLTGRAQRGLDVGFGSGGHRLHRPGLFGCQLLQAHPPLVKHLLHGRLLLENLFHLVLMHRKRSEEVIFLSAYHLKMMSMFSTIIFVVDFCNIHICDSFTE